MAKQKTYLEHCTGIYAFLGWLDYQTKLGMPCKNKGQMIYAHPFINRYFSLGIAKGKGLPKQPFLAIQPNEANWFKMINWEKACIRERDLHLYFISATVPGNGDTFPDIPPIVFSIAFDTLEKIKLVKEFKNLVGREYREENGKIFVNYHKDIFSIPVHFLSYNEPIIASEKGFDYESYKRNQESLALKEKNIAEKISDNVEFQGDLSLDKDGSSLLKKLFRIGTKN